MSKEVYVRPIRKEDAAEMLQWSSETANNLFDPEVAKYPTTFALCAFSKDRKLVFLPVQQPLMCEALAISPDATVMEKAKAFDELVKQTVMQAYLKGAGEVYFLCSDKSTSELAERHNFQRLPWPIYRMKLSDLERA